MYDKKSSVAIIPARGGSKRIPHKNIIEFHKKPLIAWTIESALKSNLFDKVIVSTDDEQIKNISIEYGAEVPLLRDQYADDFTPVSEATIHTLKQLLELGMEYKVVVQLFSVCPLRYESDIVHFFNYFNDKNLDFLLSCYEYISMNPWWAHTLNNENIPTKIFSNTMVRSQDLPKLYCPSGAIWIAKIDKLLEYNTFYGKDYRFLELDWRSAIDIDTYDDLDLASYYFSNIRKDK